MNDGKVHRQDGTLITPLSPFKPQQRIYYYREVENEPVISFEEQILFADKHLLVAFKPHFLPLMPGGIFVNEHLQHRLRLHMQSLGWPILNDRYYPSLQSQSADDYSKPLQLLAKELRFIDPVTQQPRVFNGNANLTL